MKWLKYFIMLLMGLIVVFGPEPFGLPRYMLRISGLILFILVINETKPEVKGE